MGKVRAYSPAPYGRCHEVGRTPAATLGFMARDDATWELNLAHAVEWVRITGEMPQGQDFPAQWLALRRSEWRRGVPSLTPERIEKLDGALPGWRETLPNRYREWTVVAEELRDFVNASEALPRQSSDDIEERRLGHWLNWERIHLRRGKHPRHRTAWLDAHVPEWRGGGPRSDAWMRSALEFGDWVRKERYFPSQRNDTAPERRLVLWMQQCLKDVQYGDLSVEQIAFLDDAVPGWRDGVTVTLRGWWD